MATSFYKSQLFSTNRNFLPQITTIFYKPQLLLYNIESFYTLLELFGTNCNLFSQKQQLFFTLWETFFSQIPTFFCNIATFFLRRNERVFSLDKWEKRYIIHHEARMANAKRTGKVKDAKHLCKVKCPAGLFKIVL